MEETAWLIQRAEYDPVKPLGSGLDSVLYFHYMGSAEFGFGALPAALKTMRAAADRLEVRGIPTPWGDVYAVAERGSKGAESFVAEECLPRHELR